MYRRMALLPIFCVLACLAPDTSVDDNYEKESLPEETQEGLAVNQVTLLTSMGEITIELNPEKAPISVQNFIDYVDAGFYDGDDGLGLTTFHRIIADFMIQGGGFNLSGSKKETRPAISNEGSNGLLNVRGSVAMARTSDPNSATSQFFINHIDNAFLDYVDDNNPGYAVFGQVIAGMDVVDAIATVTTDANDAPLEPVVIEDVARWND